MGLGLKEEKKLQKKGYKRVAGLDEAGRGPLAGPVTAAAVIVQQISDSRFRIPKELKEVYDSKKFSSKKREELYKILINHPQIDWGVGRVGPKVIDRINILNATKLAMERAVINLRKKLLKKYNISHNRRKNDIIDFLILDGNFKINLQIFQKSIIKADKKVFSCAAASIISKVSRDRTMLRYHKKYPRYGFDRHKGYPTKLHFKTLKRYGPLAIHRKSFKPVADRLK